MKNKKLIRFVESFVLLPVMTISIPQGFAPKDSVNIVTTPQIVLSEKLNSESSSLFAFNQGIDKEAQILKIKADAIDAYFKEHNMPLEGTGMKMAQEAKKNGIDWRLLPGIAYIETSGGKNVCKNPKAPNNPFGWGSCKLGFESFDEAIETVALNLGGKNPNTDEHYAGKTTIQILKKYNSIIPTYSKKVIKVMDEIGDEEVVLPDTAVNS